MTTITLGIDLGDRMTTTCQFDAAGAVTARGKVATTCAALQSFFATLPPARVILEVGRLPDPRCKSVPIDLTRRDTENDSLRFVNGAF